MKKSILLIFGFLLVSCFNAEKYEHIAGEWQCSEWITASTGYNNCKDNVYINFNSDKTYSSKIGALEESGVYYIAEDKLYCTPTGKLEIGVEINELNKDTLKLVMSRSGEKEILTLVKK